MTGIQATERLEKDLPVRPGKVERKEFEYIRHGTQTLIANFDVATGKIIEPTCGDSRTESDFLLNICQIVESDPNAKKWHLIMDCLNTHQSESLVRFVAEKEGLDIDLGIKGKTGILKSMKSRATFLSNPEHKIVFHCSPFAQISDLFPMIMAEMLAVYLVEEDVEGGRQQILNFCDTTTVTLRERAAIALCKLVFDIGKSCSRSVPYSRAQNSTASCQDTCSTGRFFL